MLKSVMVKIAMSVVDYHENTKHRPHKCARAPEFLDWETQPIPYSAYKDVTAIIDLPLLKDDPVGSYPNIFHRGIGVGGDPMIINPSKFNEQSIGAFLELSLGLSAWKELDGKTWALRMNPSSGNLHPTEAHLVLGPGSLDDPALTSRHGGVFHYNPYDHCLEERASLPEDFWTPIAGQFKTDGFFIALTSIYWREAWKYGERAFRYVNLDVGHALAALSFSAALQGWQITYLNKLSHDDIENILGFDRTKWIENEREEPELICFVHRAGLKEVPKDLDVGILKNFAKLEFSGEPRQLSKDSSAWQAIEEVSASTRKPKTMGQWIKYAKNDYLPSSTSRVTSAAKIIRQRRSGQAYDPKTGIKKEDFFALLDRTIPRKGCAPFDVGLSKIRMHLILFVHNVEGLEPGIYAFLRDENAYDEIKKRCGFGILWQRVKGTPKGMKLYLLDRGDFRERTAKLSCDQDIAGDGAFTVALFAHFLENIERTPYKYRSLFWEAGMIGQLLYLEAEALGLRGTGLGCFFDDSILAFLNIMDNSIQNIYQFTIGKPIEDPRITTKAPYSHKTDLS